MISREQCDCPLRGMLRKHGSRFICGKANILSLFHSSFPVPVGLGDSWLNICKGSRFLGEWDSGAHFSSVALQTDQFQAALKLSESIIT